MSNTPPSSDWPLSGSRAVWTGRVRFWPGWRTQAERNSYLTLLTVDLFYLDLHTKLRFTTLLQKLKLGP